MTTTLRLPDVQTSPSTVHRIREILTADLPLRTAHSLVEFELSGRQFSPFHRRNDRDVRIARIAAGAFVATGPSADQADMVRAALEMAKGNAR